MTERKGSAKYLVFSLGNEFYAIPIESVREIIRFDRLTPVHDSHDYIMGVINLRGKIIPVLDLRMKLGMDFLDYSDKTVLIIIDVSGKNGQFQTALSVDAVHEVVSPGDKDQESIPDIGMKMKRDFLTGIIKSSDRMTMVLNMNRIVTSDEVVHLQGGPEE